MTEQEEKIVADFTAKLAAVSETIMSAFRTLAYVASNPRVKELVDNEIERRRIAEKHILEVAADVANSRKTAA